MAISSALGSSALLPAGLGFRNKIINGAMTISQRGTTAISNVDAVNTYGTDRWHIYGTGSAKLNINQSTTNPSSPSQGFSNSTIVTSLAATTAATTSFYGLRQYIEGYNAADLAWGTSAAKPIVISFWVRSSIAGTYSVALHNAGSDRSLVSTYTISTGDTWEKKTVYINAGDITGTWGTSNGIGLAVWFDLGSGTDRNGTAGVWNATLLVRTSGSVNWIATNGATFYLTGVQLEQNYQPTPFEQRPIGTETSLCQRYYTSLTDPAMRGVWGGATNINRMATILPVKMRAAPAVTLSGTLSVYDGTNTGTVTALGSTYSTVDSIEFDAAAATGTFTLGRPAILYNSTAAKINCNSEWL